MANFNITKGLNIPLTGKPRTELLEFMDPSTRVVYPLEFDGLKQRLKVAEGDTVKRGSELMEDKNNVSFKLRSPVAGRITSIHRGARRFVDCITIEPDKNNVYESFGKYTEAEILQLDRKTILDQLVTTGYLVLLRQRPFSGMADPENTPKSIFVNAMNTGPFQVDANVVTNDDPKAFQAGLDLMTHLTDGSVYLCAAPDATETIRSAKNIEFHTFSGPHPAGNTSVHISRIDPLSPHDIIWHIKAVDLVLIGRLFLDGQLPESKIISLGGPEVREDARCHYRVPIGANLQPLLSKTLNGDEVRVLNGDALSGSFISDDRHLAFRTSALTVLEEDRERHFLGWVMPGFNLYSFSRSFISSWLFRNKKWNLGTNCHGDVRAMVLRGYYDRVMPMNILVDYLVRAVLAEDTDEAIALGILETDPEDFALCDFVCPSKMEVQTIIRDGLEMIEKEGI